MQNKITRARAVIIHNNCVLFMKRIKAGYEYYTLPGGKLEAGETPQQACSREVFEETSINTDVKEELYCGHDMFQDIPNTHYIFLCDYLSGVPVLGGEEKSKFSAENYYEPLWIKAEDLPSLEINPVWQKPVILSAIENQ